MNRDRRQFEEEEEPGIGRTFRREMSQVGSALIERVGDAIEQSIDFNEQELTVEIPADRGIVGKRIVVEPDEVHVVTGEGRTRFMINPKAVIYGVSAEREGVYWANPMTSIVAMKTSAFPVKIMGLEVLDSNNVRYFVDVDIIAELDPIEVYKAASKIGNNVSLLISNIEQRTSSELRNVGAKHPLIDVIRDREKLRVDTEVGVRESLKTIGYTLNSLTIGALRGMAVDKLVEQSTTEVERDATIKINTAQLATNLSNNERARQEAEVQSETDKITTAKDLEAEQANETARIEKEEVVAARQHEKAKQDEGRSMSLAEVQHGVSLQKIDFDEQEALKRAEAEAAEALRRLELEKEREQQATLKGADISDLQQQRELAREAERTEEEAKRLLTEKTAEAERAAVVKTKTATSEAEALRIRVTAENETQLASARSEASAAEFTADAKTKVAAATRAEEAASGLAASDVRASQLTNDAAEVAVVRDRGLAEAQVEQSKADAEIHREQGLVAVRLEEQRAQAELFASNPAMLELQKFERQLTHDLHIRQAELEAQVRMVTAMAEKMDLRVNIIGDGGQASRIMANVMAIASGAQVVGEQVPFVGSMLSGNGHSNGNGSLLNKLPPFLPFVQQAVNEMEPRVFTRLTLAQLADAVSKLVSGQSDLITTLNELREDSQFRVVADLPVATILEKFGITVPSKTKDDSVLA